MSKLTTLVEHMSICALKNPIGGAEMRSHALKDVFNPFPAKAAPATREGPASVGLKATVRP